MEGLFTIENIYNLYTANQFAFITVIMMVTFYPLLMIIKKVILPKFLYNQNTNYGKIFIQHNFSNNIISLFIALYLLFWTDILDKSDLMNDATTRIKDIIFYLYVIVAITSLLLKLIDIIVDIHKNQRNSNKPSIELHLHILRIVIIVFSVLSIFSLILGISISSLFTSLGAAAALLTFVFKDTVLGLLSSLQLTFQNIIQVGDWVTLPKYDADGDIKSITITVVVIRNFDGTHTTVPTSAFLTTGVKNWRPMFEGKGRRIKRSMNIDISTIKVCSQKILDVIREMPCMKKFSEQNKELFNSKKNKISNISMFRYYIKQYLRANQNLHQEGFTFLIRELEPSPDGLPLEIYVFTKDTRWANYEEIQADIFDHLLVNMYHFELKIFQNTINFA